MSDSPARVFGELRQLGYSVVPIGDRLQIVPADVPAALLDRVIRHKDGVLALARIGQSNAEDQASSLEGLRQWLPALWGTVQLADGTTGILWGVTARGVMVSRTPKGPIVCYPAEEVGLAV